MNGQTEPSALELGKMLREREEYFAAKTQLGEDSSKLAQGCVTTAPPSPGYRYVDTLRQLTSACWDGNLCDKCSRDALVKSGLVERTHGWNFLTAKGVEYCVTLGILRA